jgi:signal transduction histidine kinase
MIKDNGPGISPENHTKIFQIFTVLKSKDKFGVAGNGIGLVTVKKLIEALGGAITVESSVGEGATFIFDIKK